MPIYIYIYPLLTLLILKHWPQRTNQKLKTKLIFRSKLMLRLASPFIPSAFASQIIRRGFISGLIRHGFVVKREISSRVISRPFSTDDANLIDRKLIGIFESELNCKRLSLLKSMPAPPADFPFTIQDDPKDIHIYLTRELDGEKINLQVSLPCNIRQLESTDSDSDEESGKPDDADPKHWVTVYVRISRGDEKIMEFGIRASAAQISVCEISVKKPAAAGSDDDPLLCAGPYFVNTLSDLHVALREFLEIRGIKESNVGFLHKYMVRREKQRPMLSLQNLKKFIGE